MKKIILLFSIFVLNSCSKEQNYVSISGDFSRYNINEFVIVSPLYRKIIKLDINGQFSDTLILKNKGYYKLLINQEQIPLFLVNGYNLNINIEHKDDIQKIIYKGKGSKENNILAEKVYYLKYELKSPRGFFLLNNADFSIEINNFKKKIDLMFGNRKELDSVFVAKEEGSLNRMIEFLESNYEIQSEKFSDIAKGKPSPQFYNYESNKGKKIALDSFKGTPLLIIICTSIDKDSKEEIAILKSKELKIKPNNLKKIYISLDESSGNSESKERWHSFTNENGDSIHVLADDSFNSEFIKKYWVNKIPRFILLDEHLTILSSELPNPSNPKFVETINQLLE